MFADASSFQSKHWGLLGYIASEEHGRNVLPSFCFQSGHRGLGHISGEKYEEYMFSGEYYNKMIFNEDIGGWNVGNVVDFEGMFRFAQSFNQNIGSWSTSQATSMAGMFEGAIVFNQDISSWNVSSVIDMRSMFDGALVFDRDITIWTGIAACAHPAGRYLLECECFCMLL